MKQKKKEKTMNEVAKKETEVAKAPEVFGVVEDASPDDIQLSTAVIYQKQMEFEEGLSANYGDFIDTNTKETLGTEEAPLEIIPLFFKKLYRIVDSQGLRLGTESFIPGQRADYETVFNGVPAKRQLQYSFFCLNARDLSMLVNLSQIFLYLYLIYFYL